MRTKTLFLLLAAGVMTSCCNKIEIANPTVEMQDGSQPLATATPRFSWNYHAKAENVMQVDYRIVVASSEENARKGIGDLWDSKAVATNRMLYIPYEGTALTSRSRAWWKVYATVTYGDKRKKKSLESDVQHFEVSLLNPDDWHAHWIGRDFDDDSLNGHTAIAARYLRKEFTLGKDIVRARLYISGLGVYSAYLNGNEVAPDELLKPTLADYTQRIYFNAYDVTDMLATGANAVGVTLEGGRFTTIRHDSACLQWCGVRHAAHYGRPQLLMQMEVTYADGTTDTIVSGEGWKITNQGPIRKSNEFDGEAYDARCDLGSWTMPNYDDSRWLSPVVDYDRQNMNLEDRYNAKWTYGLKDRKGNAFDADNPCGSMPVLSPQPNPNIKVQETLQPIRIFAKNDKWIVDMGQNMVGIIDVTLRGMQEGDTITFRYAETLTADSNLYTDNLRSAEVKDCYIAKESAAQWKPMFNYHGFRYVEIGGLRSEPALKDICGLVMYDAMPCTGTFETSNEVINAIYHNAYWGIRSNYRSMPTDCPQRDERMGWTGDRTTGCYGESYIFGNHRLYAKWLQDLADCQWPNGSISDVAPAYWRMYTDNMTWPGAFITVADMLYHRYGDFQPIACHYDAMKRWLLHMKENYLVDGILTRDTYGDWCVPPESPELIHSKDTSRITCATSLSTPFYCHLCTLMAQFAQQMGRQEDAAFFLAEAQTATDAYNAKYLDTVKGCYANNTVTANILPLAFGMVPEAQREKVFGNIISKTEQDFGGHVSTGVVGIQQLMRTLTEYRRGDLALRMATDDTYPSWGYMYRNGATTIWELWNGNTADPAMNSGNHVMLLGDLVIWYYEYLGGIRPLEPGYTRIALKPYPIEGLDWVNCSYHSVSGEIVSKWRRKGNLVEWDIVIPPNTTAEVCLPTKQILHSGRHRLTFEL